MKKKLGIIIIIFSLIAVGIFIFQKEKANEQTPNATDKKEKVLTKEDLVNEIQAEFQTNGLGIVVDVYPMKGSGYLVLAKQRNTNYEKDFPGDQLIWVDKKEANYEFQVLSKGDYKIHLVMNDENEPYYLSGSDFLFSFYEGKEINGMTFKGKGYVYEVQPKGKLEMVLETSGDFYDFGFNKESKLMFIERVESDDRNRFPSYFAPYVLHHKEWKNGKWVNVKEQEATPNIQKEHEKLKEAMKEDE